MQPSSIGWENNNKLKGQIIYLHFFHVTQLKSFWFSHVQLAWLKLPVLQMLICKLKLSLVNIRDFCTQIASKEVLCHREQGI